MNNTMEYRGYHARVEYSAEDGCFIGQVMDIADTLAFDGENVQELKEAFQSCIDEYLAFCQELGREPDKEFKGSFNVRIPAQLHRDAYLYASINHLSLNQVVIRSIENFLTQPGNLPK